MIRELVRGLAIDTIERAAKALDRVADRMRTPLERSVRMAAEEDDDGDLVITGGRPVITNEARTLLERRRIPETQEKPKPLEGSVEARLGRRMGSW